MIPLITRPEKWTMCFHSLAACLLFIISCHPAFASKAPIYTAKGNNLAVGGYDPVTYFTGVPLIGSKKFQLEYKGALWQFIDEENRETFKANPDNYAPQFGGYCAFSVAQGSALKGLPELWTISNGKLYLNRSHAIHERWLSRQTTLAQRAHQNWPYVLEGQLESIFRKNKLPATK